MDDRQLMIRLTAAQQGDDAAMTALIADFLPFIRFKASAAAAQCAMETDDLAQEGMIGLLSAVRTYDASAGASLRTWACTCIVNSMRSAMRRARRAGAVPAEALVPIDEAQGLASPDDPVQRIIARDEAARLQTWLRRHLSVREQQVLRLYIAGCSYAAIADRLSLPDSKSVDNSLQRIRKKIRSCRSMP